MGRHAGVSGVHGARIPAARPRTGRPDLVAAVQKIVREKVQPNGGARFRILTESINSPTLAGQIEDLLKTYADAKWCQYEAAVSGNGRAGARMAFGETLDVRY